MKKTISLLLAILMIAVGVVPAMATETDKAYEATSFQSISIITEETDGLSNVVMNESNASSAVQYAWKAAFKIIKWLLVKGNNALFNRQPTIQEGENWVASSTGKVSFGNGTDDVRRVKFTNTISVAHNCLDVFAQAPVTGWLSNINIFIEDSSGDEVCGGQVSHNQHIITSYDLPLDTYTAYYVHSGSVNWDCWIQRIDFSDDYRRNASASYVTVPNAEYNPETQKSYIIPSDGFTSNEKATRSSRALTAQDLVNEFHDDKLNCSVNRMKKYDIDDTIYVTDVITGMEYDNKTNVTIIYFGNTTEGSFLWPFNGDLRNKFNVNDKLTFKFNVVEEYATNEYSFETLDYFLKSYDLISKNTADDIENYLVG